jgi:hypothetical protein
MFFADGNLESKWIKLISRSDLEEEKRKLWLWKRLERLVTVSLTPFLKLMCSCHGHSIEGAPLSYQSQDTSLMISFDAFLNTQCHVPLCPGFELHDLLPSFYFYLIIWLGSYIKVCPILVWSSLWDPQIMW